MSKLVRGSTGVYTSTDDGAYSLATSRKGVRHLLLRLKQKKAGKRDMHICRLMIVCLLWRLFVGLRRLFCGVPYEVVGGS